MLSFNVPTCGNIALCHHVVAQELKRTTEAIARVNARWRKLSTVSSICQHVAIAVLQMCRYKKPFPDSIRVFGEGDVFRSNYTTQGDKSSLECFSVEAPTKAKIRPRPARGLVSIERT